MQYSFLHSWYGTDGSNSSMDTEGFDGNLCLRPLQELRCDIEIHSQHPDDYWQRMCRRGLSSKASMMVETRVLLCTSYGHVAAFAVFLYLIPGRRRCFTCQTSSLTCPSLGRSFLIFSNMPVDTRVSYHATKTFPILFLLRRNTCITARWSTLCSSGVVQHKITVHAGYSNLN